MRTCPNCGEELPEKFKLCGYCGTPLAPPAPAPEVRKVVTVVFSDLAGSTALGERLDSESLRAVMDRYFAGMRSALEAHGGTIEKFIGDAVMAVFGLPTLHEDDALRAVRAAAAMVAELAALNDELEARYGVRLVNRTGVNTGEVVAGDPTAGQRLVTGDAVNVAARLEQAAPPGGVLLGALTHRLVRDAVESEPVEPLELKGKSLRVPAYRLLGLALAPPPRAAAPLIGREPQLGALRAGLAAARRAGQGRMRLVVGGAGVGKSRLADEFAAAVAGEARVLRGRALSYGRGITFWPLSELVRGAAGIEETDPPDLVAARLAALVGPDDDGVTTRLLAAMGASDEPFAIEELFWAARKLLERLAADQPVVAIFEDLHWAELSFLRLIEHVTDSAAAPVLVVATARQQVLELEPGLGTGERAARITLEPLSEGDTDRVLTAITGGVRLPARARRAIVAAAGGNPLFAEQMLSMLIDDGRLARSGEGWKLAGQLRDSDVPPTIQALLAARLDQLEPEERSVVEPASVIGTEFDVEALRVLAPEPVRPALARHLQALGRKQLLAPVEGGEEVPAGYRFEHAMIRETAYGRLLKRRRAELHEAFVAWAQSDGTRPVAGDELDELLGYHLEQAHRYLRELGPLDAHGHALGTRASAMLGAAGRRAFAREDTPAAASLLRRAAFSLEPEDPARSPLVLLHAEALMDLGDFTAAESQLEEALGAGDPAVVATARVLRALVQASAGPEAARTERIVREARRAIPVLEAYGEHARLAAVWRWTAWAHCTAGRYGRMAEAAEEAIRYAGLGDDQRQRRRAASVYAVAALYGPTPVPDALARCESVLHEERCDRRTEGLVRNVLARLLAMQGDPARARAEYRRGQAILGDGGRDVVAASTSLETCGVEVLAGDLEAAARELRRDLETLTTMGETYLRSTVAGELSRVLVAQGRLEEAWEVSEEAESLAEADDVLSQAVWRLGRARLLARTGEEDGGRALAEEAVELLRGTDDGVSQADALTDLAIVSAEAGRHDAAGAALAEALAIHEAKGNRTAAARVRALAADRPAAAPTRV